MLHNAYLDIVSSRKCLKTLVCSLTKPQIKEVHCSNHDKTEHQSVLTPTAGNCSDD